MKTSIKFLLSVIVVCISSASGLGAVDMYLQIDNIKGESTSTTHPNTIELLSFSWGMSQGGSAAVHSGGSIAGKASLSDFSVMKVYKALDSTSPPLLVTSALGTTIPTVTMFFVDTASPVPNDFFVIKMTNVFIAGVTEGNSDTNGNLVEEVSFNFQKIEWTYTPIVQGEVGTPIHAGYDVKANVKL